MKRQLFAVAAMVWLVTTAAPARAQPISRGESEPGVLQVFVREGCPHCADAKVFLSALARERPELRDDVPPRRRGPARRRKL